MHNLCLVQIHHCLDNLLHNGAQRVYILYLVVRQSVHILLHIATGHQLQQNSVLLLISVVLPPYVKQVFDDARVAQLPAYLELAEHILKHLLTQLVVIEHFAYFGNARELLATKLGLTEEDLTLGSRPQLLDPGDLEVVGVLGLLLALYIENLGLDAEVQQFTDVLRDQEVGRMLRNVVVRVEAGKLAQYC